MTLITAFDLLIAQLEEAIQINGHLRNTARNESDELRYNRLNSFSRRLNSLHSKMIVARAEVTNLCIHGCVAVASTLEKEESK